MANFDIRELSFTYSRSSGAGGQNVNKLNTKATLSWSIYETKSFNSAVLKRFVAKYSHFITDQKLVKITSQRYRNQARNTSDCLNKLNKMIESVRFAPKRRLATKPTRGSVERRIKNKKAHSDKKKSRQEKF